MKRAVLIACFFFAALFAWSLPFIGADTGLLFIIDAEAAGAPSPVILQGLGVTFPLVDDAGFFLHAGLLIYGCQYMWFNDRAVPADNELDGTIWVLLPQLDIRAGFPLKLSDSVVFGASLGASAVLPIPLFATSAGEAYRGSMFAFFYLNLKFIYAEAELFIRWAVVEGIDLAIKVRGMYQLAAIWDDLSLSRFNGLQIQALISLEMKLKSAAPPPADAAPAPPAP